jgi:hypothetical protein
MPERRVIQAEALAYLESHPASPRTSVITSLPDLSETPALGLDGWRAWFVDAVRRVVTWVPLEGVAIFYQSDIRQGGFLVDKSSLVFRGAEAAGALPLWHKIVCRRPSGTLAFGRPTYSHMICVERSGHPRTHWKSPGPDVLPDSGFMPWSRAMGVEACRVALAFVRANTATELVVDPFCGHGTVLATANAMGFHALGVDTGAKRCRAARALTLDDELRPVKPESKGAPD